MSITDDVDCDELISRLAGPLTLAAQIAFRQAAEEALAQVTCCGEGIAYRVVATLQRKYFDPPSFGEARWGTARARPSRLKDAAPIAHAGDGRRIVQYHRRER
jgi:hypothetical protein